MSLAFAALRMVAVMALKGRTWARERVRDSEMGPLDSRENTQPAIIVYTDEIEFNAGAAPLSNDGPLTVAICAMLTSRAEVKDGEEAAPEAVGIPLTDAGMELIIDMLARQIQAALVDPENAWGQMWARLCRSQSLISCKRGDSGREGLRLAARELIWRVETIGDPMPGADLPPVWAELLQLCADSGDADAQAWGQTVTALIAEDPRDPAAAYRAWLGVTDEMAEALLESEIEPFEELVVEGAEPEQAGAESEQGAA